MNAETKTEHQFHDDTPRAPGAGSIAQDLAEPRVIQLDKSPLLEHKFSDTLRKDYLDHEVVLQLHGPMSIKSGEPILLRWQEDGSVVEDMASKSPIDVELANGETKAFKFKASKAPRRAEDGSFAPSVRIVVGTLQTD